MRNNVTLINPYEDKSKVDLRSDSLKAYDYINYLAVQADAQEEKFVQNSLKVIRAFSHNPLLINQQVKAIEQRLRGRIEEKRRTQSQGNVPGLEVFQNGVIDLGQVSGANIDAKLTLAQFSGNFSIYGQYGMGKSNLNQCLTPQLISQGVHVDIFDVAMDYRDLLQIPGCEGGLVLDINHEKLNPLEPIGEPGEHLQFFWEITQQDFNLRPETKELLFNYSEELYQIFNVYSGDNPPTLINLKDFLKEKKTKSGTTVADKRKIETALRKIDYILYSFGSMANCPRGFSLEALDRFSFVTYEIGELSEDKRSWYIKLKLRQYHHRGNISKKRHKVKRIIELDEAKGILGKSRIGEATNYIKDMYTRSRSIGCWWIITDQFSSELADFTKASALQISFQHTVPKELRNIAVAMGSENLRAEIPRIGRHRAFVKMTDFPYPFLIMTRKSAVTRHITDEELERLMQPKLAQLNRTLETSQSSQRVRLITKTETEAVSQVQPLDSVGLEKVKPETVSHPLKDLEDFLKYINNNPGTKVTGIYKALNYSGRKGTNIKEKAKANRLIEEIVCKTGRKGRSVIELQLTSTGKEYIREK